MDSRKAARAAAFAADAGVGATFALAVARLAFCGGFDIGSDNVIEEAAAVAGLNPAEAVAGRARPAPRSAARRDQPRPAGPRDRLAAGDQHRRQLVRRTECVIAALSFSAAHARMTPAAGQRRRLELGGYGSAGGEALRERQPARIDSSIVSSWFWSVIRRVGCVAPGVSSGRCSYSSSSEQSERK